MKQNEKLIKNLENMTPIDIDYKANTEPSYYSGETLDSLASKTGISRNSLFTTIDKVREILKKELND